MQNNVNPSPIIRRTAAADLSAKTNFIAMLNSTDGAVLHDGSAVQPYLIVEGAVSGKEVALQALIGEPVNIKSAGIFNPTVPVFLDLSTAKATATVTAVRLGFAEQIKPTGEGQVLVRPDVQFAQVPSSIAALGLTAGGSYNQTYMQNVIDKVDAVIAQLKKAT